MVKKVKRKTPGRKVAKTSSPVKMSSSPAAYSAPPSSFMPGSSKKRPVVLSDSSSADDEGDSDIPLARLDVEQLQVKTASSPAQEAGNLERAAVSQDETGDEDEDELPVITPSRRRKRSRVFDENDGEDGGGDGDGEDAPIASSPTKKRKLVTRTSAAAPGPSRARNSSGEELEGDEYEVPVVSSSQNRSTRRAPRSDKEKARELLRRKRAGETIEEEDLTASSSDKEQSKGLYDTDSEHEALVDFDDDEEGVPGLGEPSRSNNAKSEKKGKEKARASRDHGSSGKEEDLDDFVVEDDDAALGVPGELLDIPLEFTAHRHKPLKEHFKHAVEWLVQSQINPSFPEKTHDLYKFAWRRLDDEVTGLASSKFASAAW